MPHLKARQLSLDFNQQCPMCKFWFPMEQLHDEDYLCADCEGKWVHMYSVDAWNNEGGSHAND